MIFIRSLVEKYPDLEVCLPEIRRAYEVIRDSYRQGSKLLVCGNGGSAADAEHIVGELMKGYFSRRPISQDDRDKLVNAFPGEGHALADRLQGALPAISLVNQVALMTAYANDVSPEMVYAQQVFGYGKPGDVLLGLSTSGNSANVLNALKVGKAMGLHTIGFTGKSGGLMKTLCEVAVCVPWESPPAVQERHLPIIHALCQGLEEEFFS